MELLRLFKTIDIDHNGKLSREELQLAFSRAGLAVPSSKLDVFFSEVDANRDGSISFEEWRYVDLVETLAPQFQGSNAMPSLSPHIHSTPCPHGSSLTQTQRFPIVHARNLAKSARGDELLSGYPPHQPRRRRPPQRRHNIRTRYTISPFFLWLDISHCKNTTPLRVCLHQISRLARHGCAGRRCANPPATLRYRGPLCCRSRRAGAARSKCSFCADWLSS